VEISANDTIRFDVTEIKASPGQAVHVQLQNNGTLPKAVMGHNWILLDSGGEANRYAQAAMVAHAFSSFVQ
jgi:azurin